MSTGNIYKWEWNLNVDPYIERTFYLDYPGEEDNYINYFAYSYTQNGAYPVSLTIYGPECPEGVTLTREDYILVTGCG